MGYTYAVLGGGRQGTAAAYDMARWGAAERVRIADISADAEAADASASRVNTLIGRDIAEAIRLDVILTFDIAGLTNEYFGVATSSVTASGSRSRPSCRRTTRPSTSVATSG